MGTLTVEMNTVGCPHNDNNYSAQYLLHQDEFFENCTKTIQLYESQATEEDKTRGNGENKIFTRIFTNLRRIRRAKTKDMSRCVVSHEGCDLTFYHDRLESDEFYSRKSVGMVLVVHNLLNDTWTPFTSCTGISMAVVIGSSMGSLFFLGICLLIAAIVIINVNDYRNWKKYQAWRKENEERLGAVTNPLYEERKSSSETFMN